MIQNIKVKKDIFYSENDIFNDWYCNNNNI
jgi:hypothetical protein